MTSTAPGSIEAVHRTTPMWIGRVSGALAVALFLFIVYTALRGEFSTDIQRGVPFALIAVIVLLRHPVVPGARWLRLIDVALIAGAIYAVGYVAVHGDVIVRRLGRLNPQDVTASLIGLLVLFEIARRTVGLLLPSIALAFAAYAAFGNLLPGSAGMSSASPGRVALASWVGTDGVFGVAFGVMVGVVYVYVLLASLMERSGGTHALVTVAHVLTRGTRSGPGMTTVASSGLFGMASGSGVADVAAVGTANIPAMKSAGYSPPFSASVQALSSIGAQVMPPIMGSSAFILAELTSTPYAQVALMAIIPALLYYVCVASAVHFEARRLGLKASGDAPPPLPWSSIALGVAPLVLLVWLLVQGMSPSSAGLIAVGALLAIGLLRRNRQLAPRQLFAALLEGTIASLPMWTATAVIGVIVASVALTGLTTDISLLVVKLSKDSLLLALMVVMLASIVLGTALPTIAAYLLLVIMVAPALQDLGVPLIIAHFFVFYYGVTSDLTPPTALAPLTAAAMAGANFWQTCWLTMKIGLPIFILPFAFVYHPELLLMGQWSEIFGAAMSCALGIIAFSAGAGGYLLHPLGALGRVLLTVAGLALIAPGTVSLLSGLVLCMLVLGLQALDPETARRLRI
jgi:TRAP transporter 4TM/12TM fusion protein